MKFGFLKKYIVLVIVAVMALALLAFTGFQLMASAKHYGAVATNLQSVMDRLQQLYQSDPYPDSKNVKMEIENGGVLLNAAVELNELLRHGQVEPQSMEAADFMPLLENTLKRLREQLQQAKIIFPPKFNFGFDKYASGLLPAPPDIPQLVQQLKTIEKLCQVFPAAGISELVSIGREEFDLGAKPAAATPPGRRGQPGAGPPAEEKLYAVLHYKVLFRAKEPSAFETLNLVAKLPMFTVVTSVEINNQKAGLKAGGATPAAARNEAEAIKDRRVILGKEEVEVKLELDVFQLDSAAALTGEKLK